MKTKIIIYLACLAGLILVSSCSTHDTIMKRRYMKGYYVSKHERTRSVAPTELTAGTKIQDAVPRSLSVSLEPATLTEPMLAQRTDKDINPIAATRIASGKAKANALIRKIQKPAVRLSKIREMKKPLASDSGGLSLFWIVILVILVLWAIGFLTGGFGIGNLINLLLVVALVLLILWLLRII